MDQLCSGLESGTEGATHAAKILWQQHSQEEEWGFLLVDAKNAFNKSRRAPMYWTFQHEWPADAKCTFNSCKHWSTLIVRDHDDISSLFLQSKEGLTKGDPLATVVHSTLLLPLIRQLKTEMPEPHQPWHADDGSAGVTFASVVGICFQCRSVAGSHARPLYMSHTSAYASLFLNRRHFPPF